MIVFNIIVALIVIEILFRICYRVICGYWYVVGKRERWKDNYVVAHPFLSLSYKKNSVIKTNKKLNYILSRGKYSSFVNPLRINNFGHFGNDFEERKDSDTLRIACLGNSTTANNIAFENKDYCYPDMLQKELQSKIFLLKKYDKVEVYNFGIGGWVCQDILIDFVLNVLRTNPDYVIFCHGYVDLPFHLMDSFSCDYFHGRRNLGEVIRDIQLTSYLPSVSFWKLYEFLKTKLVGSGNVRKDVVEKIRKQKINYNNNFDTLKYEADILKNIFIICKYFGIRMIVSTYSFYNFGNISAFNKIEQGVEIENENIKKLSEEFDTIFVDHAKIIPKNDNYFLDWVHFTPKGMQFLAKNYSKLIVEDINKMEQKYENSTSGIR